jgi:hypothetical protein
MVLLNKSWPGHWEREIWLRLYARASDNPFAFPVLSNTMRLWAELE